MRGSALVIVMLVTASLTVLGLGFLAMADTETLISSSGRNTEQLFHTAETGVRLVKAWFDQPVTGNPSVSSQVRHKFLDTFDLRNPAFYDRTRRTFDHDGDPNTPDVLADGSAARPYYRQGRTLWSPSAFLDIFHKPYRGDAASTFMGTEDGPDIVIRDIPGVVDFIDVLNARLFSSQAQTGRITEIAIYAPPKVVFDGTMRSAGICTIKVTAAKYRRMGSIGVIPVAGNGAAKLGQVVLKAVLAEVPGAAADGPLESCGPMSLTGTIHVRWGRVIAEGDTSLPADLDGKVPSGYPYAAFDRRIHGAAPGDDYAVWSAQADNSLEDPWFKLLTAGDIAGFGALAGQPFPYDQAGAVDADHSNLFQHVGGTACAAMDYGRMKSAATSGEEAARYFAYDAGTGMFKEWGVGPARSVHDWTHNAEGLFFFDTMDGLPPNGHGPGDPQTNLTPAILISGVDWGFSGLLYLNAESIAVTNAAGVNRVVIPPGEPFDDVNRNGRYDAGETFVNLQYPTTVVLGAPGSETLRSTSASQSGSATSPDNEFYSYATSTARDPQGIPITGEVNLFGVLYNAGNVVAEGSARHYGSLIAGTAVVQTASGAATPEILFDERLNTGTWPPAEITFPRTQLTLWARPSS